MVGDGWGRQKIVENIGKQLKMADIPGDDRG